MLFRVCALRIADLSTAAGGATMRLVVVRGRLTGSVTGSVVSVILVAACGLAQWHAGASPVGNRLADSFRPSQNVTMYRLTTVGTLQGLLFNSYTYVAVFLTGHVHNSVRCDECL